MKSWLTIYNTLSFNALSHLSHNETHDKYNLVSVSKNRLKPTYSNLEFQAFSPGLPLPLQGMGGEKGGRLEDEGGEGWGWERKEARYRRKGG